jgi:hypothetical protein
MAVVLSHIGRPSKPTTAQKESIASRRSHIPSEDSGGGVFCVRTAPRGVVEDDKEALSAEAVSALFVEAILQLTWSSCRFRDVALGHVNVACA